LLCEIRHFFLGIQVTASISTAYKYLRVDSGVAVRAFCSIPGTGIRSVRIRNGGQELGGRLLCDIIDLIAVMVCEDDMMGRKIIRIVAFFFFCYWNSEKGGGSV